MNALHRLTTSAAFAAGILTLTCPVLAAPPAKVRFATYNVSFFRGAAGALAAELANPAGTTANHVRIRKVAEALQRMSPDVVLLNEFDYDANGDGARLFHDHFLAVAQKADTVALHYPYRYTAASNTGVYAGFDFNNDGVVTNIPGSQAYGDDCFGFGEFEGKYGMVVYSRYPIDAAAARTFRLFRWKDMPGALLPDKSNTPQPQDWYSLAELSVFRLSSKSHWDLPVDLGGGQTVHFLVSHPTPPTFDAAEDRNGKRNHDEIRFWADYIDPARSGYQIDDAGVPGGLPAGARFVIAGDNNADPNDGDTVSGAARQYTQHPLIDNSFIPVSAGAAAYSSASNGQAGPPAQDTAAFSGGLRVDYVLPSMSGFSIADGAVYWPSPLDPLSAVIGTTEPSDHHAVWLDLVPEPIPGLAVRGLAVSGAGESTQLTWQGAAGYSWQIESAGDPAGPWAEAGAVPVVNPETFAVSAAVPRSGARQFLRVRVGFAP